MLFAVFILVLLASITRQTSGDDQKMIKQSFFQGALEVSLPFRLSITTKSASRKICALYSYQSCPAEGVLEDMHINAQLKATSSSQGESHLAIEIVVPQTVYLSELKRSKIIDVLILDEILSDQKSKLPEMLESALRPSVPKAAVTSTESRHSIALIAGVALS